MRRVWVGERGKVRVVGVSFVAVVLEKGGVWGKGGGEGCFGSALRTSVREVERVFSVVHKRAAERSEVRERRKAVGRGRRRRGGKRRFASGGACWYLFYSAFNRGGVSHFQVMCKMDELPLFWLGYLLLFSSSSSSSFFFLSPLRVWSGVVEGMKRVGGGGISVVYTFCFVSSLIVSVTRLLSCAA